MNGCRWHRCREFLRRGIKSRRYPSAPFQPGQRHSIGRWAGLALWPFCCYEQEKSVTLPRCTIPDNPTTQQLTRPRGPEQIIAISGQSKRREDPGLAYLAFWCIAGPARSDNTNRASKPSRFPHVHIAHMRAHAYTARQFWRLFVIPVDFHPSPRKKRQCVAFCIPEKRGFCVDFGSAGRVWLQRQASREATAARRNVLGMTHTHTMLAAFCRPTDTFST